MYMNIYIQILTFVFWGKQKPIKDTGVEVQFNKNDIF